MGSNGRPAGAGDNRSVRFEGKKLEALRRGKVGSRQKVASASERTPHNVSVATIKRAERGAPVYLNTAHSIAALLGSPLHELLAGDPLAPADPAGIAQPPMIAVLPLRTTDGEAASFADGLADDVITRLSRFWFPVIARTSSLNAVSGDAQEAAKALGAQYWIDGTVRRAGSRLRVTVQLAHAGNGTIVFRDAYECALGEVFRKQNELTSAILAGLSPRLLEVETRRFERCDPSDLDAWQESLLGAVHFYRRTADDNARARALLASAVRRDSHMPLAWYTLALTHQQDLINQWSKSPRSSLEALQQVSHELERLYPDEASSQVACAYLDVYQGQRDAAIDRLTAAIELDPNACLAYTLYGQALAMAGEPDRALEQFEVALRLNPKDTERWSTFTGIALTHFTAERYAEAVRRARAAVRLRPNAAFAYAVLASALAHLGKVEDAKRTLVAMREHQPGMSLQGLAHVMGSANKEVGDRYLAGLRSAGLEH